MFLTALAFLLAYRMRVLLDHVPLEHDFHLAAPVQVLLLGWSMLVWVAVGIWWQIYDRIDAAHPRVILRDTFRQCLLGAVAIVLFEFARAPGLEPLLPGHVRRVHLGAVVCVPFERRPHSGHDAARVRRSQLRHGGGPGRSGAAHGTAD